jgi:carbonic anhydrase
MAPHDGEVHWSYEGENGPQAWGKLKPDFNVCAIGKRQSPINIEASGTLQGPAEPLQFNYQLSNGTVVNNGHTIQVDVLGDNSITVRGSTYKLLQFHFHNPSEERVNYRGFAMVAHLVHKNAEGQLAVVAVLLDPGVANALINKVWTYMPLDTGDRVRMPTGLIDMNELLPKDQRYYQFMGSLTTPPCTEGVLWLVLKQPTTVSREQIKLFSQLFPNNARPVQPVNGRAVRDAQ